MELVWKYALWSVLVLTLSSVSVKTENEAGSDQNSQSLELVLSPKLYQAFTDLISPSGEFPIGTPAESPIGTPAESLIGTPAESPIGTPAESKPNSRRKRFSPTPRVDSKVTKLKTPKSDPEDGDVPVIRGLAGLSPIELRLLNPKEDQDDGRLIRTTTEKTRNEKSVHKKKDDGDVPVITGTKDPSHPSRKEAREGKSDDDNTVVLLNGATAQRAPGPPPPPPSLPPQRSLGGKRRCEQRKLLLQLDEQLAVLRKLNEQRDADIARSMSWVEGAGGPDADFLRRNSQQFPNVPIPYIPYVSNLPIYGRSDWAPVPLQPSYEYQVSGNAGLPIAGVYRRTWVPPPVPADSINCDYEYDDNQPNQGGVVITTPSPNSFRRPGFDDRPLRNPGGYLSTPPPNSFQRPGFNNRSPHNPGGYTSTPVPNGFQRPGFDIRPLQNPGGYVSTPAPNSYRRPGYDERNFRNPGNYGVWSTPGAQRRDGSYGRAYLPSAPKVEVDDKLSKPKDDPAEDEEQE